MFGFIFPVVLLGGAYYGAKRFAGFDALKADSWTTLLGSAPMKEVTSHVLSMADDAANFVGPLLPMGPPAPPASGANIPSAPSPDAPGSPVSTVATATEASRSLRLVQPRQQPRAPDAANEQLARTLAPQIESGLVANTYGLGYMQKTPALVNLINQFQKALNLAPDGLYGSTTAGALMYFLGHGPPPPLTGTQGATAERVINLYAPM